MNRAAPIVFLSGLVAVVSLVACSAKHEDRPPILTECGSNGQSCSGNGSGSSTTGSSNGGTAADSGVIDSGVIDTGVTDTGVAVDDAGLVFDSGLGLVD